MFTRTGISFSVLLFVVFLVLKLLGTIDWSWLWVTSPLWISFIISLFVLLFSKIFNK